MNIREMKGQLYYVLMSKYFLLVLYLVILLDGGGFEYHTTFFMLFISLLYINEVIKVRGYLFIEKGQITVWKILILLGGIFSALAGIDRGESIYGLIRLITILVAGMAIRQIEEDKKIFLLKAIPIIGVLLIVGCALHKIPMFGEWVSSTGRMNGSFRYSNTMALFLLLGIILAEHFPWRRKRLLQMILALGILGTGSRTAFIMLCGYLLYCFIKYRGKNKYILLTFICAIGLVWGITALGGDLRSVNRFLKLSIDASTFQGRLLYWEDAVRMLWKKPLGLGYMGYFYLQQAEQTGVYSVRFVHNEWLQWILDYGILAGIGLVGYIIQKFRQIEVSVLKKELLTLTAVYCFFDFHLQFFSIVLLVLFMFPEETVVWKSSQDKKKGRCLKYSLMVCLGISFCMGVSIGIAEYYAKVDDYGKSVRWDPLSAQYKQEYLLQAEDLKIADAYADRLLEENKYLYAAYLIKSNAAAQNGNLESFIENRKKVLSLRKYKIKEYEDYIEILFSWYLKAKAEGNSYEAMECLNALGEIQNLITETKKKTSLRAYRIQEKPNLILSKEYVELIEKLEEDIDE